MQVLYERDDVVDYRITFHCIATNTKVIRSLNFNSAKGMSQAQTVAAMAAGIHGYQLIAPLPQSLDTQVYVRGKTHFGDINKYYEHVADSNGLQWFKSPQGSAMGQLDSGKNDPDYVYSPPLPDDWAGSPPSMTTSYSIVGSPQQTDCGVEFSVLLDPRINVKMPPLLVKIDNSVIRQITLPIPLGFTMPLANDGSYVVAKVRHHGDTRGNEWTTDITGYTRAYTQGLLRGQFLTGH